ncbi:MAG TPA: LAGLIDADG family homing endonuclease, partial [Streptosporangiaceae bacterium]|nr:LAGLIDADG family homing endonuclease [Streptosporangiaceae bacterium]
MTETVNGEAGAPKDKGSSARPKAAKARAGLKIKRIHTTAGVHPYDQITWERRDVVMTNWRDGSINFEQRGVEFPDFWSVNAANIVTTKYFRGAVGSPQREFSLKQLVDRVVGTYERAGKEYGYFASDEDAEIFGHELRYALAHQIFSFNSPVWFNVGTSSPQQVSACFILAVDDTMDAILEWYREEGLIFKGGSGSGVNLSRIRSSKELLSSGGTASGPVSFMRGADASAGTIKSGGATRRAAKMVVLDVDHPDIREFVKTKAREEDKVRALRDAGFDMDLGGKDIVSVQYQNANNSVRVSDEFMRAVEEGKEFDLLARRTGEVVERIDARGLLREIATAAWECADPGIQYDGTINDWHTNPESGRITASNPCFPADQRVVTDKGLIRIGDLVRRAASEEQFGVYTNDVTAGTDPRDEVTATVPTQYMVTGTNEILELRFSDGSRLRCTPGHRVWTAGKGWVHAEELTEDDKVVRSFQYAERPHADPRIPLNATMIVEYEKTLKPLQVPSKWDEEFAHYLGWLTGDGCIDSGGDRAVTVYGSPDDQEFVLPKHRALLTRITGFESKPSIQANGTLQLRVARPAFCQYLYALGVSDEGRAAGKVVPSSVYEAPEEAVTAFLRGLFDADGCVVDQVSNETRYVGLGSRSEELLIGVQELLASLGIASRIYKTSAKKAASFHYTRKDGTEVSYGSDGLSYDLRITAGAIRDFHRRVGFVLPSKQAKLDKIVQTAEFYNVDRTVRMVSRVSRGFETTYNLTEPRNHSYIVSGTVVANCSEYMSLDNSSCNLASINLLKFLRDDDTFDAERFAKISELIIIAMDISISFADFPTEKIADTTRKFRQLGIGYANLGALLMATGHAYDSESGRAIAAAITSLMTGTAYRASTEMAAVVGPYEGYARNASPHKRVIRKHAAASEDIRTVGAMDAGILTLANKAWAECIQLGEANGYRNAQASLLAPTGCLTADTLVTTSRGLTRLGEIADVYGNRWQDLADVTVSTDEGPQQATKFFINGEEPTRRIVTQAGYKIQGTLTHRVKVVNEITKVWEWKRLADIAAGDLLPIQRNTLVGEPNRVPLPVLDQAYYAGDRHTYVPDAVSLELAELVGYFMGDGSLHAKGIRFCVADTDLDVVSYLAVLAKELFGIEPVVTAMEGYQEVTLQSVRLARWWQAAGFAKSLPNEDHTGKGWIPRVPSAILEANDPSVYGAFLRGLFEADGTVLDGVPSFSTAHESFAAEIRTMLLTQGLATTTRQTVSGWGGPIFQVRLRNIDHALNFSELIGFISQRKDSLVVALEPEQSAKKDYVVLPDGASYLFERVAANEDGGVQPTYDLSVPANVTYVANGMVSHNTIGLMMDCDTTGIEPDLALVKFKKLVGGGSMQIVNQTVPRALKNLGYPHEQIEAITEYIAEHGHVVNAPGLRLEHYEVFDCAMGERSISPMGHVRMMAAVQTQLSGAISKTVNVPESATVEDIERVYFEGWKLGLKALAIYRDNCKVGQPLTDARGKKASEAAAQAASVPAPAPEQHEHRPVRRRLPRQRPATVTRFSVAGAEGYMTASSYPDDGVGEVFLKLGKQGSTLAGVMDAFSMAISVGLQYGIPLESYIAKFTNMRFEPAGLTDDPDIRLASSVMDYIFRRLALDHLSYEQRAELGILSATERSAAVAGADEVDPTDLAQSAAVEPAVSERPVVPAPVQPAAPVAPRPAVHSSTELIEAQQGRTADAPLCLTCGTKMRPAGSCYVCEGCG